MSSRHKYQIDKFTSSEHSLVFRTDLKELNLRDLGPKLVIQYGLGQFSRWHQASGEVGMLFA
ncbi:MAG: hypothetical protein JKY56_07355 [Kofleriaceae bacterium]|nr:hypothetical protein [Kofleriaceae bacterium]